MKNRILLHVCCGVCAIEVIRSLSNEFDELLAFFYNPNIEPKKEYEKRLAFAEKAAGFNSKKLTSGEYDNNNWRERVRGLENESEGGKRCEVCFKMRLEESAKFAKANNCNYFATTLTISPHKNAGVINKIGQELADKYGLKFLIRNFYEEGMFKEALKSAKDHDFYRQKYCGCLFSKKKV